MLWSHAEGEADEWEAGPVRPILALGRFQSALGSGGADTTTASAIPIPFDTKQMLASKKKPQKTKNSSCAHFYKSFKHVSLGGMSTGRPAYITDWFDDARLGDNPEFTTAPRAPYLNFRFNKTAGSLHLFHINCCLALSPAHTSPPAWMKSV